MDQLKDYVSDPRHLTPETQSELREYADELNVDFNDLWRNICKHNTTNAILHCDSIRDLVTTYRPRATDSISIMGQAIGMSDFYKTAYGTLMQPRKRKKKKVWNHKTKQYEMR